MKLKIGYVFYIIVFLPTEVENVSTTNDVTWENPTMLSTGSMFMATNSSTRNNGNIAKFHPADISADKICNLNSDKLLELPKVIRILCEHIRAEAKWRILREQFKTTITPATLLVLIPLGLTGNIIALIVLNNDIFPRSTKIMFILLTSKW